MVPKDIFLTKNGSSLIYIKDVRSSKQGIYGEWKCFCGEIFQANNKKIKFGSTTSCGCYLRKITQDRIKDPNLIYLYRLWSSIKNRCYNEKTESYKDYGGRGIIVFPEWKDNREKFVQDILQTLGHKPNKNYTFDRINNNGNYEPGNIRWATRSQQNKNTRKVVLITVNGVTKNLSEWSELTGIRGTTIKNRLDRGCVNNDLFIPVKKSQVLAIDNIYSIWNGIKERCFNDKSKSYKFYGAKGITLFEPWLKYSKFKKDIVTLIGLRPSMSHSLDRIDNNKNYEPGNIQWADSYTQSRNRSNNVQITINEETKTLQDWSNISGINAGTISFRIKSGWPESEILRPVSRRQKFSEKEIQEITHHYNNKMPIVAISKIYKCQPDTITDVILQRDGYSKDK